MNGDSPEYDNLCDICHKNPATIHFTQVINGVVKKINLCEECARKQGINIEEFPAQPFDILGKFLSALALPQEKSRDLVCPKCGKKLSEFREDGKLGCPQCWVTFREELIPLLEKLHGVKVGGARQRGKRRNSKIAEVKRLQKLLEEAVEKEEFEEAARLRDEIKKLQQNAKKRKGK